MTYYLVTVRWARQSNRYKSIFLVESTCPTGALNQVLLNQQFLPQDDRLDATAVGLGTLLKSKLPVSLGSMIISNTERGL